MSAISSTPKGGKMASIFKRDGNIHLKYYVDGKVRRRSTGLKDTTANRKHVNNKVIPKLEAQIALGLLSEKKKKKQLFDYYKEKFLEYKSDQKSFKTTKTKVNRIIKKFKGMYVDEIKRTDVKDFVRDLLIDVEPKTVRNTLSVLSGIFDVAIEDEAIKDNPCTKIKLPANRTKRVEPFTNEQVEQILSNIEEDWFRNFVAIGFYSGMRTGEIIGLMKGDIDFDEMVIRVRRSVVNGKVGTPKTGDSIRDIPLFSKLEPYLKAQMSLNKQLFLFTTNKGEHYYGSDVISAVRWKKVLDKCQIKYRRLYTTRHTFITAMLKSGVLSIMEIARIVGHTNIKMIITNYARFIEGEQLKINRDFNPFKVSSEGTRFGARGAVKP